MKKRFAHTAGGIPVYSRVRHNRPRMRETFEGSRDPFGSTLSKTQHCPTIGVHLKLRHTQVTDAGLETLGEMPQLVGVGLDGNEITDDGLAHLKNLTSLESLPLNETPITDAGL